MVFATTCSRVARLPGKVENIDEMLTLKALLLYQVQNITN